MKVRVFFFCFVFCVILIERQSYAVLGGSVTTIESDRNALSAVQNKSLVQPLYSVHEIQFGLTMVREYVSNSGIVFGVAWSGYTHPDLRVLLGEYLSEYDRSVEKLPKTTGARQFVLDTGRLVVKKRGHMRDLRGFAYDPTLIPSGVKADVIQ